MQTQSSSKETACSVEAIPSGFISRVKEKKQQHSSAWFALRCPENPPEWRPTVLTLPSRQPAAPRLGFILIFIYIARPSCGKLIGFAWVMSTIDRKYNLIRNREMFNGAMEDTKRGRGWRLMERRLPGVSSLQSDLLITHCFGLFYLTRHANWQRGLKIRGGQHSILSSLAVTAHCATY